MSDTEPTDVHVVPPSIEYSHVPLPLDTPVTATPSKAPLSTSLIDVPTIDDTKSPAGAVSSSVIVVNGDLGKAFPLGRGLDLGSGSFRVVGLRYEGLLRSLGQIRAGQTGAILDDPARHGALVRNVRHLSVRPSDVRPRLVNVDGLRMTARGEVRSRSPR